MSDKVRIINGFVEINYERFAQVLPGKDERTLKEELLGTDSEIDAAYEEGFDSGRNEGLEEGAEEARSDLNDKIDSFFDKLLKDGAITEDQHNIICEGLPSE